MTAPSKISLADRVFRAGTAFELVVYDRLPLEEQAALAELTADPDFYGILRPQQPNGQTLKSVNRDTALLWLTMRAPGPLPFFVLTQQPEVASAGVWQLVLDGVLETEEGGRFVSGVEAAKLLTQGRAAGPQGTIAQMSRRALRQADRLRTEDAAQLADWLYRYGVQPMSARWFKRLPDSSAVLDFVGAGPGTARRRLLDSRWELSNPDAANGWIAWSSRGRSPANPGGATYKLYVSPQPEAMPEAFAAVHEISAAPMHGFKIGASAAGLLRPDKMVLYFDSLEKLLAVASELDERLSEVPAHGVPFSAQITANGLLSWGMDPPQQERRLAWQDTESWRLWVVRRLALAMCAARSTASPSLTSSDFALERLKHEGVDVDDWKPAMNLWRAA
jgi:hypothetical protein